MVSHKPLLQLRRLDKSSPKFIDELADVLCGEEYRRDVPNFQGDDLLWLVDFLDMVCCRITPPRSPLKPS